MNSKLIPNDLLKSIPALYYNEDNKIKADDMIIHAKLFMSSMTWYIAELSEEDGQVIMYCWVENLSAPDCSELGYTSLNELEDINKKYGFPIVERDLYFKPTKLSNIRGVRGY